MKLYCSYRDYIPNSSASRLARFFAGFVEAPGGHGAYDQQADEYSLKYFIEDLEEANEGKPLNQAQYTAALVTHRHRTELNTIFYQAERNRTPETTTEYVWLEDEHHVPRLYHRETKQFMYKMFENTRRFAEETGRPGIYNEAEAQSFLAIEQSLREGRATGGLIATAHESETVRYMTHISLGENAVNVRYVDVGIGYRDLYQNEADAVLSKIERSTDTVTKYEETGYQYLLFHGRESPKTKHVIQAAIYTAYVHDVATGFSHEVRERVYVPERNQELHDEILGENTTARLPYSVTIDINPPPSNLKENENIVSISTSMAGENTVIHTHNRKDLIPSGLSLTTHMIAEWLHTKGRKFKHTDESQRIIQPQQASISSKEKHIVAKIKSVFQQKTEHIRRRPKIISAEVFAHKDSMHFGLVLKEKKRKSRVKKRIPVATLVRRDVMNRPNLHHEISKRIREKLHTQAKDHHGLTYEMLVKLIQNPAFIRSWEKVMLVFEHIKKTGKKRESPKDPHDALMKQKVDLGRDRGVFINGLVYLHMLFSDRMAHRGKYTEIHSIHKENKDRKRRMGRSKEWNRKQVRKQAQEKTERQNLEQALHMVDVMILFMLWNEIRRKNILLPVISEKILSMNQMEHNQSDHKLPLKFMKDQTDRENRIESTNNDLEGSSWLLFAIIYYLAMIREQGIIISNTKYQISNKQIKKNKRKKKRAMQQSNTGNPHFAKAPWGKQGVIYAFSS